MFRRLESSLPKDFEYPADLAGLGYCINEKDQIRSITRPLQEFHYFISKNERACEIQREAMNTCIRQNVLSRLALSGTVTTRLPLDASADDPHVPILTSANISTAKQIIVYFGDSFQDLGIFAYRTVGQDSIAAGSVINFINAIQASSSDPPAVVIANLGQSIWYRRGKKALTQVSWRTLPMKTAVSLGFVVDKVKNSIPKNESMAEHVKCVFEDAVGRLAHVDAKVYVIGVAEGAVEAVEYLQKSWEMWKGRVEAIAIGSSHVWRMQFSNQDFKEFWGKRVRAYIMSGEEIDTPLTGRVEFGCNCYSTGEVSHIECIMPKAYLSMLRYLSLVADNPEYEAPEQDIPLPKEGEE